MTLLSQAPVKFFISKPLVGETTESSAQALKPLLGVVTIEHMIAEAQESLDSSYTLKVGSCEIVCKCQV